MRVGIHDHFFYQGGDSFTAMRLVSAANSSGFPVTVADVFRYPKLEEMAAYLDEQTALHQEANEIPRFSLWKQGTDTDLQCDKPQLQRVADLCKTSIEDIEDVYPCTPLQEGLMAITTQQPGAYIGRWVFRIHKTVEIVAFKEA
ncbi:hypothetical protein ARAM_000096 [Aspergillus rambellii]|uniref:Carrier domain-containing protein n=1 Tax=Aspergillus rambellii TaxID=308745 RepID=A0A0F8W943_9EURO|nr:hypothetical protein ARAM_000096 [Aspergillus rambellii]